MRGEDKVEWKQMEKMSGGREVRASGVTQWILKVQVIPQSSTQSAPALCLLHHTIEEENDGFLLKPWLVQSLKAANISLLLFFLLLCFNLTCSVCWGCPWSRLKASEGPDGWTDRQTDVSSILARAMIYSVPPTLQNFGVFKSLVEPEDFSSFPYT